MHLHYNFICEILLLLLEEQWIGFPLHTVDNIRTYVVTTTGMCMSPQHRLIKIYIGEAL